MKIEMSYSITIFDFSVKEIKTLKNILNAKLI